MVEEIENELTDQFFEAVLSLENMDECYQFFRDNATVSEVRSLARRLEVARLLKEGSTYDEIVEETGVSSATVGRVKKVLEYGEGGLEKAIDRL